jgi:signal transduction histidine kinase
LLSTDELITGIGEVMLILMISLIIALVLVSDGISKTVWQSFHDSLIFLKSYDIKNPKALKFKKTRIEEFHQLNDVISAMIEKSIDDYSTLKEFSENASHEIQTPLSIIKLKSELLMQDKTLKESQLKGISTIYTAANRLSKLNHDLVFLTKIDSNQFLELTAINLTEFVNKKLSHFEDLIVLKNIAVNKDFSASPKLLVNDTLIYVMITNLLNNSIKHNVEGGEINLRIRENELVVENTGLPLPKGEKANDLFLRFKKASQSKDSSGLGLALVKRIVDLYGMHIDYKVKENIHSISIMFDKHDDDNSNHRLSN